MLLKQSRKILTLISILSIVVIGGILISALFGAKVFNGNFLKIILSASVIAGVSTFSISALSYYEKKRVLSIVNLVMLIALGAMLLIIIWLKVNDIFSKITITLAIATGLVGIMNGNIIQLGKRYRVFQIISILLIAVTDVLLTLVVWGKYNWTEVSTKLFVILMIVAFVDVCVLSIFARKSRGETQNEDKKQQVVENKVAPSEDEIVIKKTEYEEMKNKIQQLENQLNELKIKNLESQVEKLKNNNQQ